MKNIADAFLLSHNDLTFLVLGPRYEWISYLKQLTTRLKMFIYKARATGYLNISCLLIYIASIKDTEKKLRMLQKGDKNYIRIGKMF